MPLDRCPGCRAAVAPTAQWCTLCFCDLRVDDDASALSPLVNASVAPALAPLLPPAAAVAARPEPPLELLPAAAPALATVPEDQLAPEPGPAWPCSGCGRQVPLTEDRCPACGVGFLAATDDGIELRLPVVGDVAAASSPTRLLIGLAAGAVLTVVLLAVLWLLGSLL